LDKKPKIEGLARKGAPARGRSRWGREKRWRYIIEAIIVLTIVAVPAIVGYGYYDTRIKPWHQPIVRVNDTVFDMGYFVKMLRVYGLDSTSDISSAISSAQSVATTIQDNELMKQGLEKDFGVVISDEAIQGKIRELVVSDNATDEEFQQKYKEVLDYYAKMGVTEKDLKQMIVAPILIEEELRQRVGDQAYPADQEFEHVRVQAMLVAGADNATAVRDAWSTDGDFDKLVVDYSPSKSYGETSSDNVTGEWIPQGIESAAFGEFAFAEESVGTLSNPIPESEGSENYWVIKVLEKGSRLLSAGDRDTLIGAAFGKWLEDAKSAEANKMVNYLDSADGYSKIYWALDHI